MKISGLDPGLTVGRSVGWLVGRQGGGGGRKVVNDDLNTMLAPPAFIQTIWPRNPASRTAAALVRGADSGASANECCLSEWRDGVQPFIPLAIVK